jgi:putative lipoprotein
MNLCMMVLCLSLQQGTPQRPADRWVAEDKWKHFFASFVVTALSAAAARTAGADAETSALVGAGVGTSVGVWKELRDMRSPGETASLRDLTWDVAGVGAAAAIAAQAR